MKKLLSIFCFILISACASQQPPIQDKVIVEKYKYIISIPPISLTTIPPQIIPLSKDETDDKVISNWFLDAEKRTQLLEDQIIAINDYFVAKIKNLNIPKEDVIINQD